MCEIFVGMQNILKFLDLPKLIYRFDAMFLCGNQKMILKGI